VRIATPCPPGAAQIHPMTDATPQHIRFAGADDKVLTTWAQERQARDAVRAENRRAALERDLDPTDPRWVLAARVRSSLQGSTLTPERRARLHREAKQMGIRPFDATMIMAIVQDRARRGETMSTEDVTLQLLDVRPAQRHATTNHNAWLRWSLAILCAVMANVFLIWWLDLL